MSVEFEEALDVDARAAEEAAPALISALVERVRARVGRRRRIAGGMIAGGLALLWGGVALLPSPSAAEEPVPVLGAAEAQAEPVPVAELVPTGTLYAEALLQEAESRIRTGEDRDQQAAVACHSPTAPDTLAPCTALWVSGAPLLAVNHDITRMTTVVSETTARIEIIWALDNVSRRDLHLERGDLVVALEADPRGRDGVVGVSDGTAWGASLWSDDRERFAANTVHEMPELVDRQGVISGLVSFEVSAPAPGEAPDVLWGIATGAVTAHLTVQVGLMSEVPEASTALILEVSAPVEPDPATTAEALMATFTPRSRGEVGVESTQAALLCDVPEALRVSTFTNPDVPYAGQQVDCEPGWVDGPATADDGWAILTVDGATTALDWSIANVYGSTLSISKVELQIEASPESETTSPPVPLGSTVATPASAWTSEGKRSVWIDNVQWPFPFERGTVLGAGDTFVNDGDEVGLDVIQDSLTTPGTLIAQVFVPFVGDPTRVLILETPITVGQVN